MTRTEGTLLLALLAEKAAANPRDIKFIDLPIAQDGKFGLTGYDGSGEEASEDIALVDSWGERYYLLLESTGDGLIPNPERLPGARGKTTQRAPESIPAFTLIFSLRPRQRHADLGRQCLQLAVSCGGESLAACRFRSTLLA